MNLTSHHTAPVTLNLFQGPFLALRRSVVEAHDCAVRFLRQGTGYAARWMLKQVQHDEVGFGFA